jgi:hypothetical protein
LKTDETRLRVTLQDADFDLRDDMHLITQLQNRSKSQESVLRATTAVATELHEKAQAELRRAKEIHARKQEFAKAQEKKERWQANKKILRNCSPRFSNQRT